ncbi:MAG: polysaccharide deacetylase family protein [Methyloceanibacter sp.]|nr:polysaccharide deacetylase family protein [Methyloceanibacter sp.]
MKKRLSRVVRQAHVLFAAEHFSRRVALYFHDLVPEYVGAFRDAVATFLELGYATVDPSEYAQDASDASRKLFVSFDDNYRSWFEALEIFDDLGIQCTFYVNTCPFRDVASRSTIDAYFDRIRYTGDRTPLSRSELRAISDAGHNIGCHTHTHFRLSGLPKEKWFEEIDSCKALLEDIVGHGVSDFSFPFGMRRHFSAPLRRYCRDLGFRTIATAIPAQLYAPHVDPFFIHRTGWKFDRPYTENLQNLKLDARMFGAAFGRSAIG